MTISFAEQESLSPFKIKEPVEGSLFADTPENIPLFQQPVGRYVYFFLKGYRLIHSNDSLQPD